MAKTWTPEKALSKFTIVDLGNNQAVGVCMLKGKSPHPFFDALPLGSPLYKKYGLQYMKKEQEKGILDSKWMVIEIADLERFTGYTKKKTISPLKILEKAVWTEPDSAQNRLGYFEKKKDAVLCMEAYARINPAESPGPLQRIPINETLRFSVMINDKARDMRPLTQIGKSASLRPAYLPFISK